MSVRDVIAASLKELAAPADIQRALDFPPYEFCLFWHEYTVVSLGERANPDEVAKFDSAELRAFAEFDDWLGRLPPESDPMWNRRNLDAAPWPEIRARAGELLAILASSSERTKSKIWK